MSRANKRRIVILAMLAAVALPASLIAWRRATGNFGAVQAGRIYRSAQLDASALRDMIRDLGIKTVLNLRGANPHETWYRRERAATLSEGATQVDMALASDQWLARDQARALIAFFDTCDYPVLIHCEFGAERTGLVSALAALLRDGSTLADAEQQFSLGYLFIALKEGRVMKAHLDAYEAWLARRAKPHSPARLREWLARDYRPGTPSREYWPCNPYPLVVVTRPGNARSNVTWPANACTNRVAIDDNIKIR